MHLVENAEADSGGGNRNELVVCISVTSMDASIFCYGRFAASLLSTYVIVSFTNVHDFLFRVVGLS